MKRRFGSGFVFLCLLSGCLDGQPPASHPYPLAKPLVDRTYLRDEHGRYLFFHGVNASCSTKAPEVNSKNIANYLTRPFAEDQLDLHFSYLRDKGFNSIRLLVIWEAIEPDRKGVYDEAYLAYLRKVVETAAQYNIYVLLDMHQDMFSRHLNVRFNRTNKFDKDGALVSNLMALVPDIKTNQYNDQVQGDGAPRWVVQSCLQEKKMDSPHWGKPRILSGMTLQEALKINNLIQKLTGKLQGTTQPEPPQAGSGALPEWVKQFGGALTKLDTPYAVDETTDMLPFTNWPLTIALSLDVARCYACLLAGNQAFPTLQVDGQPIQDYLQEAYANSWAKVAEAVRGLPNVMGYDLMNEPGSNFLVLGAVGAMLRAGAAKGAASLLETVLGPTDGPAAFEVLQTLKLLPPDTTPATLAQWGLDKLDLLGVLGLNMGFDQNHMRPFYSRIGQAILAKDPDALIYFESGGSAENLFGGGLGGGLAGMWGQPMTLPEELSGRAVYAPHWYPDIYPYPGFNQQPRSFSVEEVRYRDFAPNLRAIQERSPYSMSNIPVMFGEFGTYFNFGGIDTAMAEGYAVSAHILDNYYEAFDRMFMSRMVWCYSADNDNELGDLWNQEDFSILGPMTSRSTFEPRAEEAWSRPYARAMAGKPISTHYYSPLHYFDPQKGQVNPVGEFEVRYESRETDAPTEIVIPDRTYPQGFYVWTSDGQCHFDPSTRTLYHRPIRNEPGFEHWVRIQPPLPGQSQEGWQYFFKGDRVLSRG